jgi:hypothetical protein
VALPDGIVDLRGIEEIVSVNEFGIHDEVPQTHRNRSLHAPCGLLILPSFANHSWVENEIPVFYGDIMVARALRDLRDGKEVVSGCISTPDRREVVNAKWNISCQCEWCLEEDAISRQVPEQRRAVLNAANRGGSSTGLKRVMGKHEATYKSGDWFRVQVLDPLLDLMNACMRASDTR